MEYVFRKYRYDVLENLVYAGDYKPIYADSLKEAQQEAQRRMHSMNLKLVWWLKENPRHWTSATEYCTVQLIPKKNEDKVKFLARKTNDDT